MPDSATQSAASDARPEGRAQHQRILATTVGRVVTGPRADVAKAQIPVELDCPEVRGPNFEVGDAGAVLAGDFEQMLHQHAGLALATGFRSDADVEDMAFLDRHRHDSVASEPRTRSQDPATVPDPQAV